MMYNAMLHYTSCSFLCIIFAITKKKIISIFPVGFLQAGIGEHDLQNKKTREFILDFIQNYSDIESIKQEAKKTKPAAPLPAPPTGSAVPPVPPRSAPKPAHNVSENKSKLNLFSDY